MACEPCRTEEVVLTDDQHTELYASTKETRKAFLDKLTEAAGTKDPETLKEAKELEKVYLREFDAKLAEIKSRPPVVKEEKIQKYTGFARRP